MSEKKQTKQQASKPGFFARVNGWRKSFPLRIKTAFQNMAAELKKVTWPTKQDFINYSLIVIAFVVALSIVVGVLDLSSSFVVQRLIAL